MIVRAILTAKASSTPLTSLLISRLLFSRLANDAVEIWLFTLQNEIPGIR